MRKQAHIIKHRNGFFLAINGDLNTREVIYDGFIKGMSTLKQYYKGITKGIRNSKYSSYDVSPIAVVTGYDLTNKEEYICIDDLWDPNLYKIDMETGEITYIEVNKREFEVEEETVLKKEIMKTQDKSARSLAAVKGWETKRKNIALKIAQQEAEEAWETVHQEYLKQQEKPKRVIDVFNETYTPEEAKAINDEIDSKNNQEVKDEAPRSQEASHNNNPVNHNKMKTENQNASASNDANNNVQPAKPFGRKAKYAVAKTTEVGVVLTTDLIIGGLVLTSDIIFALAEYVAWGQAVAIKPLGLHPDATRGELMKQAMARGETRSKFITALPKAAVALPVRAYKVARQASKMRDNQTIVDIENAEVVL